MLHVAEDGCDVEHSHKHYGKGPLARLLAEGLAGRSVLAAHCIHLDSGEIDLLQQHNITVQHNPRSNMNNAVGCAPITNFGRVVRVCAGTDGMSQDPSEDLLAVASFTAQARNPQAFSYGDLYQIGWANNSEVATELFGQPMGPWRKGRRPICEWSTTNPPTALNDGNFVGHFLFGLAGAPVVSDHGRWSAMSIATGRYRGQRKKRVSLMLANWPRNFGIAGNICNREGEFYQCSITFGPLTPEVAAAILGETERQATTLEMIASENFVSEAVLEAVGSVLTNKYAEGYPGKRYYGGCHNVDVIEELARKRACQLFGADYANVQPRARGASANIAAFYSVMNHGDKLLGLSLANSGHTDHGHKVNFSGSHFEIFARREPDTELIDYDQVVDLARKHRPKVVLAGYSAYPRKLDSKIFRDIAAEKWGRLGRYGSFCWPGRDRSPSQPPWILPTS